METSMRKLWFEHVSKTRKRLQRKDKAATHRQAMKEASISWPKEKVKIQTALNARLGRLRKNGALARSRWKRKQRSEIARVFKLVTNRVEHVFMV
mgnify:CR=1 FL=1